MLGVRHRAAIGVFANTADLDAVAIRLRDQGIDHCLSFAVDQTSASNESSRGSPPLSAATLGDLRAKFPTAVVLCIDLSGSSKEETLVAQTLLNSAAQSVQLHDL
ncbi:MAG: hypothetical protein MO846_11055 [Candidatus Devosia symbiotica]|nr:hypothetical protein [Candidatus Devosia symbiotica]